MNRHAAALEKLLGRPVRVQGDTDLAIEGKKFSGNAQRRKNQFLLFHGTFLLNFNATSFEHYLKIPPKQPAYRQGRPHTDFVMNLNVGTDAIKQTLTLAWSAKGSIENNLSERIQFFVEKTYSKSEWNYKF
jgi:lipoate-protein ligase A